MKSYRTSKMNRCKKHVIRGVKISLLAQSIVMSMHALAAAQTDQNTQHVQQLETVVVTATKKEQVLQRVPVAVSVISGQELDKKQKGSLEAIVSDIPSVNFRAGASNKDTSLFIRGVGTISTSPGVESSVSTVIDGVVYSRPGQATLDLLDTDRIEVLRGPQGTLFGKNATAGVINIVTKNPTEYPSGYIDTYVTNDGEQRLKLGASNALIPEVLKANISALVGRYDGNVNNLTTGKEVNGYHNYGFRSKFEYTAQDNLVFGLTADYMYKKATAPTGIVVKNTDTNYAKALAPVQVSFDNRDTVENQSAKTEDRNYGLALTAEWTLEKYQLSSITAFRQWKNNQIADSDQLAKATVNFADVADLGHVNSKQYSQEFRIKPLDFGLFEYVAGLYFAKNQNDEYYHRQSQWYNTTLQNYRSDLGQANYSTDSKNYAIFGEGTWHFSDRFRWISGLRVTRDELSYTHERTSTVPQEIGVRNAIRSAFASSGSTSETGISGRLGPQFDFTPNIHSYLTYSRGYKGPAYNVYFNMQANDTPVIDPETSHSFELGLKTEWFNQRLVANVAIFNTQYKNYQANFRTLDPTGFPITRLLNAGDVSTRGVEFDGSYKYNPDLIFTLSSAYTHARIDDFKCPASDRNCPNVNGQTLPFAPDWKMNVQVDKYYTFNQHKRIDFSTQYTWQSKTQFSLDQNPNTIQPAYGLWNASIALNDTTDDWRIALNIRNILDKSYATLLSTNGNRITRQVPRDDQRYFGLSFHKNF
nr:TonB-dependent receptor [Acinetobacter baretiae]